MIHRFTPFEDGLRLNRTSVGLKPLPPTQGWSRTRRPQSNQRGIETIVKLYTNRYLENRLNRTSVGLKLFTFIYTPIAAYAASIEPAWD